MLIILFILFFLDMKSPKNNQILRTNLSQKILNIAKFFYRISRVPNQTGTLFLFHSQKISLITYKNELYEELLNSESPPAFRIPENRLQSEIYKLLSSQAVQSGDHDNHVFHAKLVFDSLL